MNTHEWILLVEDDTEVAAILAEGLEKAGFKVVKAAHVGEANAKLAQQEFSCIITDLVLGPGSGTQVIANIRASRGCNSRAPILLMSAYLNIDLVKQLRPMINTVLVKPFVLRTLVDRVGQLVHPGQVPQVA